MNRVMNSVKRFFSLVHQLCRELSDQNAYQRHLTVLGRSHTASEWRSFCDTRFKSKYRNGRCC